MGFLGYDDAGRLHKEANGHAAAEDSSEAIGHAAAEGAVEEIRRLKQLECCMEEALAKAAACEHRLAEETQSRKKADAKAEALASALAALAASW